MGRKKGERIGKGREEIKSYRRIRCDCGPGFLSVMHRPESPLVHLLKMMLPGPYPSSMKSQNLWALGPGICISNTLHSSLCGSEPLPLCREALLHQGPSQLQSSEPKSGIYGSEGWVTSLRVFCICKSKYLIKTSTWHCCWSQLHRRVYFLMSFPCPGCGFFRGQPPGS